MMRYSQLGSLPIPYQYPDADEDAFDIWWIELEDLRAALVESGLSDEIVLERLERTLPEAEQERSRKIHHALSRFQFVAGRFALRHLLALRLDTDPASIDFHYDAYGKPVLGPMNEQHLTFNVTHSQETILIALAGHVSVGVDVEYHRDVRNMVGIMQRYYHPLEQAAIRDALDPRNAFLTCWTRKEALVKAIGMGIQFPLSSFAVPMGELDRSGVEFAYPKSPADAVSGTGQLTEPTPEASTTIPTRPAWAYQLTNEQGAIAAAVALDRPLALNQFSFFQPR